MGRARRGSVGRVHPRGRRERKRRNAPSAGRPRRSRGARTGRPAAVRRQSAVRPADGLRGRDADDQELRARARPRRALAADRGRGHDLPQAADALSALHGGAERLLHAREGGIHFGYFESGPESQFPGTMVFSCLSQDVIAHQVTHAVLDGHERRVRRRRELGRAALHEGFCRSRSRSSSISRRSTCSACRSARSEAVSRIAASSARGAAVRAGDRAAGRAQKRAGSTDAKGVASRAGQTQRSTRQRSSPTPAATSSSARSSRRSRRSTNRV